MKQVMPKPLFTQTLLYFFLINSLKQKLSWNLIYFTLNVSQLFLLQLHPLHSLQMLLNRKNSENSLCLEEVREDEIKP